MRDSDKPMSQREAYQRGYAAGYAAAQSGPPREPTQAMLDAGSLVFHREQQKMIPKWEPSIAARFWRAMWDAAPKINGGQGHEAAARCPTEGIAPSEATRLTADASGRMADATQRGQLGADAGSIPAPPTINEGGQDASTRKDEGVSKSPPKRDVPGAFQHPVPPSPDDEYCDHAWKYGARNAGCVIGCGRPRRPKAVRKQEETNTAGADTPVPPSPDAVSHAWKSGYAQAKEEDVLSRRFCPHCNPCDGAGNEECRKPVPPSPDADLVARIKEANAVIWVAHPHEKRSAMSAAKAEKRKAKKNGGGK